MASLRPKNNRPPITNPMTGRCAGTTSSWTKPPNSPPSNVAPVCRRSRFTHIGRHVCPSERGPWQRGQVAIQGSRENAGIVPSQSAAFGFTSSRLHHVVPKGALVTPRPSAPWTRAPERSDRSPDDGEGGRGGDHGHNQVLPGLPHQLTPTARSPWNTTSAATYASVVM